MRGLLITLRHGLIVLEFVMRNMRPRPSYGDSPAPREAIDPATVICPYRTYEPIDERHKGYRTDRTFAPYQPGEVMLFHDHSAAEGKQRKLARVVGVFSHRQQRTDELIPRYRVQVSTRDRYWSGNWRYLFPGDIYRAYFDAADQAIPVVATVAEFRA